MLSKNLDLKSNNFNIKSPNLRIRSYLFSLEVIKFINSLPKTNSFLTIGNQLLRSATSIGANIIEAQASSSRRDFIKFFQIALKSANETTYWLSLIRDGFKEFVERCKILLSENEEISKMLGRSLITLKSGERTQG